MIIYQISLPKKQDAEAFVTFMREQYFPALHMGQTRVGQVTGLTLLQRENEVVGDDLKHEFFWHVDWSGQPTGEVHLDDQNVARKFGLFEADVKRIGCFTDVVVWPSGGV